MEPLRPITAPALTGQDSRLADDAAGGAQEKKRKKDRVPSNLAIGPIKTMVFTPLRCVMNYVGVEEGHGGG